MEYFKAVSLKFERLKKQLIELDNIITAFTEKNSLESVIIMKENKCGFQLKQISEVSSLELDEISILLGELVHNMRSLLDNFLYALARLECDPPKNPHKLQFPIYINSLEYNKRCAPILEQLPVQYRDFITMLQPFNRNINKEKIGPEDDPLYIVGQLNNNDKHRVPIFLCSQPEKIQGEIQVEYINKEHGFRDNMLKMEFISTPITKDSILVDCYDEYPIKSVKVDMKFETSIGIEINGKYYELIPLLSKLINYYSLIFLTYDAIRKDFMNEN